MQLASLLLLGAGALVAAQGTGDRTSLIFAATAPPPLVTSPNPSGTSGTSPGTNATTTIHNTLPPSLNGTGGPVVLPLILPTLATPNGTVTPRVNGTGGPMILPWLNSTGNGTFVFPTFRSLNFTAPNLNWTNSNGTFVWPTFPPLNWTFPVLNFTGNGTTLFPPIIWGNISFTTPKPSTNSTGGTISTTTASVPWWWPTLPGSNLSTTTTSRPDFNSTGSSIVFSATTSRPFSVPGGNLSTVRPTGWPWVPTNSTSGTNFSTTTSRPGTASTQRWTAPWWANFSRSSTASSGTSRAWFGTTASNSTGTTTRSPVSFGSTTRLPGGTIGTSTRSPASSGTTARFPSGSSTRSPFSSVTTARVSGGTFGTGFPGTTTHSPLFTDVPNSLSQLLQSWRSRFAADMEAVRMNITQYLLH